MEENSPELKIYAAGFAASCNGKDVVSAEYASFFEKQAENGADDTNLYVIASGAEGTADPEVTARFSAKKILREFFEAYDPIDANRLALAMRTTNNEICEYGKVQESVYGASVLAAAVTNGKLVLGNIGDCCAYIVRNGKVFQITEEPENRAGLGFEKDVTIDIYDGIEVHGQDILILCSHKLETFIGKQEILDAASKNAPKSIVEALLSFPDGKEPPVEASAAAIRIYDEDDAAQIIRAEGEAPADTDMNKVTRQVALIRSSRPKNGKDSDNRHKLGKLPLAAIIGAVLLLLGGGAVWGVTSGKFKNMIPPKDTPTPTIDYVQASMTVLEVTMQAERDAAVASTLAAWPTSTPYPTYTPVYYDLDTPEPTATEIPPTDMPEEEVLPTEIPETPVPVKESVVNEASGSEMVYVPAGEFILGSSNEDTYYSYEEGPQQKIYLDPFWINKTEVTNAEYRKCVSAGYCQAGGYMALNNPGLDNYPLTYVSLDQAESYCSWIGGRLPTEFEWEKAARGTDGRTYPWGEEEPTTDNGRANIPFYTDEDGNSSMDLYPAGSFPEGASPYGALDMAGNVWEWTSSYYAEDVYENLAAEADETGEVVKNPTGPESGNVYVIRGGSCSTSEMNNYQAFTRTVNRGYVNSSSSYYIGFRCVIPDQGE